MVIGGNVEENQYDTDKGGKEVVRNGGAQGKAPAFFGPVPRPRPGVSAECQRHITNCTKAIDALFFTPDGQRIAAWAADQSLYLHCWNLAYARGCAAHALAHRGDVAATYAACKVWYRAVKAALAARAAPADPA